MAVSICWLLVHKTTKLQNKKGKRCFKCAWLCARTLRLLQKHRRKDAHKKTQVSQQQGQLNSGLLHNAAVIVITGQTCCNSEEPKRLWRSVYTGSTGRKKLKTEAATSSTNPTRSVLALNSRIRRPLPSVQCYEDFKYPPATTSGFTSLLKHFKNAEAILQVLGKPGI